MTLGRVELVSEVLRTITTHALTTENEEVMGLLLGDTFSTNDSVVCKIWRALPQRRTDRRRDRVEPSHRQLIRSASKAEKLTQTTGVQTRVVGWYHSHPKITVQPSHVDLRTQAHHQSLDSGFVGLIVSCFNGDQVIKCTAFQSTMDAPESPLQEKELSQESPEDIVDEMKKALTLSLHEYKASKSSNVEDLVHHKEVPINVITPQAISEYSLMDTAQLHNILVTEESNAYSNAITTQKNVSKLIRLQQGSVYVHGLIDIINGVLIPNLNNLLAMKKQNEINLRQLEDEIEKFRASSSTINAAGVVSVSGRSLERALSIPGSTMAAFDDFIDGPTFSLDQYTDSGPLSHPIESTDLDQDEKMRTNERMKEPKQTGKQRTSKQEYLGFLQNPKRREGRIQLRTKPGPSHYQEPKKNRKQVTEIEPAPSLQTSDVLPTVQYVPFSLYRTPGEAQYPDTFSLAHASPLSDSVALEMRPHPPQKMMNENRVAHSAGTRREKAMRTEAPLDPESLLLVMRGTGDGRIEGVRIPRMSDSHDNGIRHVNDASRN